MGSYRRRRARACRRALTVASPPCAGYGPRSTATSTTKSQGFTRPWAVETLLTSAFDIGWITARTLIAEPPELRRGDQSQPVGVADIVLDARLRRSSCRARSGKAAAVATERFELL